MAVALAQAMRDLNAGKVRPLYVLSGDEPFQASEFSEKLRSQLLKDQESGSFNYDVFDAETVAPVDLLASLDTLPGLFDAADSIRLVICRRFEKASAALLERLESYVKNPNPQTCFLILSEKIDKRKAWLKDIDKLGCLIEVAEPYDRDWPKWRGFFESRCAKTIEPLAWEVLVEASNRTLALVATEVEKAALYVGDRAQIESEDARAVAGTGTTEDIFQLSEDVVNRRPLAAMLKLQKVLANGESEIKLLSIFLRHFRQVSQALMLADKGIRDPKILAPQIGVPPFFVPKILNQARLYTRASVDKVLARLADCDYHLKRGEGTLWGDFLVPHFSTESPGAVS